MSSSYSIGHRSFKHNSLFAGLACAIALSLAVGPALAQSGAELARVEVRSRMVEAPVRYDVIESCAGIETQLQRSLEKLWIPAGEPSQVRVQFALDDGAVDAVKARGVSFKVERTVRQAVRALHCGPQAMAGAQVYRFRIDFVEPDGRNDARSAGAQPGMRVALATD